MRMPAVLGIHRRWRRSRSARPDPAADPARRCPCGRVPASGWYRVCEQGKPNAQLESGLVSSVLLRGRDGPKEISEPGEACAIRAAYPPGPPSPAARSPATEIGQVARFDDEAACGSTDRGVIWPALRRPESGRNTTPVTSRWNQRFVVKKRAGQKSTPNRAASSSGSARTNRTPRRRWGWHAAASR